VSFVPSLLARLQRLIETSYDWKTGIGDLSPYLVGDEGYRVLYEGREILEQLPGSDTSPRTLVTCRGGEVRLGVYYPDALIRHLEERNPLRSLGEENIVSFSLLVEELDHLLMLAWSLRHKRPIRLVELEFHANITKYLVLAHFLGRTGHRSRLTTVQRHWLHSRLLLDVGDDLPDPHRERYRTAAVLAQRFLRQLDCLPADGRIIALRRFARRTWGSQRYYLEWADPSARSGFLLAV